MSTLSSSVFDFFLTNVDDYRLTSMYQNSGSLVLDTYLEPWLLESVVDFDEVCSQDLTYTVTSGSSEGFFTADLTTKNQLILARIMVKYWFAKDLQNILAMRNIIQDKDYRVYSQANNLKAKQDLYNGKCEEIAQLLTEYGYDQNAWSNWRNQIFYT